MTTAEKVPPSGEATPYRALEGFTRMDTGHTIGYHELLTDLPEAYAAELLTAKRIAQVGEHGGIVLPPEEVPQHGADRILMQTDLMALHHLLKVAPNQTLLDDLIALATGQGRKLLVAALELALYYQAAPVPSSAPRRRRR